jgi:hypothetical protein
VVDTRWGFGWVVGRTVDETSSLTLASELKLVWAGFHCIHCSQLLTVDFNFLYLVSSSYCFLITSKFDLSITFGLSICSVLINLESSYCVEPYPIEGCNDVLIRCPLRG